MSKTYVSGAMLVGVLVSAAAWAAGPKKDAEVAVEKLEVTFIADNGEVTDTGVDGNGDGRGLLITMNFSNGRDLLYENPALGPAARKVEIVASVGGKEVAKRELPVKPSMFSRSRYVVMLPPTANQWPPCAEVKVDVTVNTKKGRTSKSVVLASGCSMGD